MDYIFSLSISAYLTVLYTMSTLPLQAAADEVLINLDALAPKCFHEVNSFTLSCLIGGGVKKKKRPVGTEAAPVGAGSVPGDTIQLPKKNASHKKVKG